MAPQHIETRIREIVHKVAAAERQGGGFRIYFGTAERELIALVDEGARDKHAALIEANNADPASRVKRIGVAARNELQEWMDGFINLVPFSPEIALELATTCFELGIVTYLTGIKQIGGTFGGTFETTRDRCAEILGKLMTALLSETGTTA